MRYYGVDFHKDYSFITHTDANDNIIEEMTIVHLLRARLLPLSYIPPKDIRDTRELIRYRMGLIRLRTVIKNKIHAVFLKNGHSDTGVFSSKNREKIWALKWRECFRTEPQGYFRLLDQFNEEIKAIDKIIRQMALAHPITQLLMTMPGIGCLSAVLIRAEIGDIARFPSPGHLCSFAGLVPAVH